MPKITLASKFGQDWVRRHSDPKPVPKFKVGKRKAKNGAGKTKR